MAGLPYWARRIGLDRYASALNPFSRLSWPIRLRHLLMIPVSHPWNARIRDWTARLAGHASYEDETTVSALTVSYNEYGQPVPNRVCDCWLLPSLPEHFSDCRFSVSHAVETPNEDPSSER